MVYLVRHAHAGSQKLWSGPDHDRPLSVRGERQAIGLLARLSGEPVARILSSPTERCRQTVVPLSLERAVPIELLDVLDVAAPVDGLLELLAHPSTRDAVLCGHGEQIGRLLRLLADAAAANGPLPRQKGATWVLDTSAGDPRAGRYLPPLQRKHAPAGPNRALDPGRLVHQAP
jgi:broad specificity phosphatase PhoE